MGQTYSYHIKMGVRDGNNELRYIFVWPSSDGKYCTDLKVAQKELAKRRKEARSEPEPRTPYNLVRYDVVPDVATGTILGITGPGLVLSQS
jgi:hypothetical protein